MRFVFATLFLRAAVAPDARCAAHPACYGISGLCCPTERGLMMDCCSRPAAPVDDSQHTIYHGHSVVASQMPTQFYQSPELAFALYGVQAPGEFYGVQAQAPTVTCGAEEEAGSECCRAQQASNPFAQGSPLAVGQVYCAQAADTRWWNVEVVKQNCDGSYAVVVQDDAKSEWAASQRAMMLDVSCEEFYKKALKDSGIEATVEAPLQWETTLDPPAAQPRSSAVPAAPAAQPQSSAVPVAPAAKNKMPWKTLSAAAAAGAVPLLYAGLVEA